MQPENIPQAAPLVIAVYGQESETDMLARTLVQDGYDAHSLRRAIVLGTPAATTVCDLEDTVGGGELADPGARLLSYRDLRIDTDARTVEFASTPIGLRRREYALLLHLAQNPTRVFSRAELLQHVWGYPPQDASRTVESHASRLRRKLAAAGAVGWVSSTWGVGYRLAPRS